MTKGWLLCIEWKGGTTSWEPLVSLKGYNTVEFSEYAMSRELQDEPAFAWWVPCTINRCTRIISTVNDRYHKRTKKFAVRITKTVDDAYLLDKKNGDTYWEDAILKKIKNTRVAFKILHGYEKIPPAHQFMRCYMIFDININTFKRKDRYVAGGKFT